MKQAASTEPFSPTAPRERVGHHWIDLACGLQLHGNRSGVLEALFRARQIAPLQARYHPQVRETVATPADAARTPWLASLAGWVSLACEARWSGLVGRSPPSLPASAVPTIGRRLDIRLHGAVGLAGLGGARIIGLSAGTERRETSR